jgi:transglutaminase-like putative cysteine protease
VSAREDAEGQVRELVLRLVGQPLPDNWAGSPRESLPLEIEAYLKGGFHLNLTDPRLARLLDRCGGVVDTGSGASDRAETVHCLEQLVDRFIRNKSLAYGFADLEEILSGREGDCTEHALLLVALLRKSGIPSRLAYGLILTEIGFIGHAWVEAYGGGRWQWLDPSFPEDRPYGLKIRLGVMDPAEPIWASLSLALLQVVGSVKGEILEAEQR